MLVFLLACSAATPAPESPPPKLAVALEPAPAPEPKPTTEARILAPLTNTGDPGFGEYDAATIDRALREVHVTPDPDLDPIPVVRHPAFTLTDERGDASDEVAAVIRKHHRRVATCVEHAVKARPDLAGRVGVEIDIVSGRVVQAALTSNTTGDDALGQCVVRSARGFRFSVETTMLASWGWQVSGR